MKKYLEILKKCPLFSDIGVDGLSQILSCLNARVMSFGKKQMILTEGSSARNIGIVLSGSVHIVQLDYYGNQTILANAYPSDLFLRILRVRRCRYSARFGGVKRAV